MGQLYLNLERKELEVKLEIVKVRALVLQKKKIRSIRFSLVGDRAEPKTRPPMF